MVDEKVVEDGVTEGQSRERKLPAARIASGVILAHEGIVEHPAHPEGTFPDILLILGIMVAVLVLVSVAARIVRRRSR